MENQSEMFRVEVFNHDGRITKKAVFDGADYIPKRDDVRLTGQIERVYNLIKDGKKRTLDEISELTGDPVASVSAQLRHLRKEKFGSHVINREYITNGLYLYWMEL